MSYDFDMENRPAFEVIRTYEEFTKYYWYREELAAICRGLGICASGYKAELNKRIEKYFRESLNSGIKEQCLRNTQTKNKKGLRNPAQKSVSQKEKVETTLKNPDSKLSLETGLIECDFRFSQHFRNFCITTRNFWRVVNPFLRLNILQSTATRFQKIIFAAVLMIL